MADIAPITSGTHPLLLDFDHPGVYRTLRRVADGDIQLKQR
jgi:hypothetical protein